MTCFHDDYAYCQLEQARQHLLDIMQQPGVSDIVKNWYQTSLDSVLTAMDILEDHLKEQ